MRFFGQQNDKDKNASQLIAELQKAAPHAYEYKDISALEPVRKLMESPSELQIAFIRNTIDVVASLRDKLGEPNEKNVSTYMNLLNDKRFPRSSVVALRQLLRRSLPLTTKDFTYMVKRTADLEMISTWSIPYLENMVLCVERHLVDNTISVELSHALLLLQNALSWCANAPEHKLVMKISRLLEGPSHIPLQPGEAWSDQALTDIKAMSEEQRENWIELFTHCQDSSGGKPSQKWYATANSLVEKIGRGDITQRVLIWFPLLEKPRSQPIERRYEGAPDPNWLIIDFHADMRCPVNSRHSHLKRPLTVC